MNGPRERRALAFAFALSLALGGCERACAAETRAAESGPPRLGWLEPIYFPEQDVRLVAKLDTGAKSNAIDAEEVELFERGGAQWARFVLRHKKGAERFRRVEAKVLGTRRIRSGNEVETRAVVELPVCFNGARRSMEFSLGARTGMNYRVILGRRSLAGAAAVDSSRTFTSEPGCGT